MDFDQRYPCIDDLERVALRRIPHFASEFLRSGIGREAGLIRNRDALDQILFNACYLPEAPVNDLDMATTLFGERHALPFGISPLGLSGLMWPRAVDILAETARKADIPMVLSHFATTGMRDFHTVAGPKGWFQLYPAQDPEIQSRMIEEVAATGFDTLVVTIDIPTSTRRDRELRVGLSVPPKLTPRTLWEVVTHPRWALATAREGKPDFKNLRPYVPNGLSLSDEARFLNDLIEGHVTRDILRSIRDQWKGHLVVKGVMTMEDAQTALECGADGIWISNHGARQLDAAPAPVEVLPIIRKALGPDVPVIADSGPRTGLDIARMLASGADFVFLGRAFIFAIAALGAPGGCHAVHILRNELRCAMSQIGARNVQDLEKFLVQRGGSETIS